MGLIRLALLAAFMVALSHLGQTVAAAAQIRKPKPPVEEKIADWIATLKEDPDESKRAHAAGELRAADAKANPEAITALIEALRNDKKPIVRSEAANSLGKVKFALDQTGPALEEALANDGSMRVRLQARSALMGLYLSGYRPGSGKAHKLEEPAMASGGLEKLVEQPGTLEANSGLLPDRVTPKTAPGKETSGTAEKAGFRLIPGWMGRRESPGGEASSPKTGDYKWWSPRVPVLPNLLNKGAKEGKNSAKEADPLQNPTQDSPTGNGPAPTGIPPKE